MPYLKCISGLMGMPTCLARNKIGCVRPRGGGRKRSENGVEIRLRAPPQNGQNNHHAHIAAPVVLYIPYWGALGVFSTPTGMILMSNTAGPIPEAFLA